MTRSHSRIEPDTRIRLPTGEGPAGTTSVACVSRALSRPGGLEEDCVVLMMLWTNENVPQDSADKRPAHLMNRPLDIYVLVGMQTLPVGWVFQPHPHSKPPADDPEHKNQPRTRSARFVINRSPMSDHRDLHARNCGMWRAKQVDFPEEGALHPRPGKEEQRWFYGSTFRLRVHAVDRDPHRQRVMLRY